MNLKKNKGFSLIELIIVVAVMAILVGVLAPAYTHYVKKSRVAKCETQREELEKVYHVACVEDAALAECKDTIEVKNALGGKDPVDYLKDQGYFEKGAPVCPVHHKKYELEISTTKGATTVTALCPCVDTMSGYVSTARRIWEEKYKDLTYYARQDLIKDFYDEKGSLMKVSDKFQSGTYIEKKGVDLYWRPYLLKDGTVVLYASASNDSTHAGWRACLLYKDGEIYQCSETAVDEKPPGTSISSLSGQTSNSFDSWITSGGAFARAEN